MQFLTDNAVGSRQSTVDKSDKGCFCVFALVSQQREHLSGLLREAFPRRPLQVCEDQQLHLMIGEVRTREIQ